MMEKANALTNEGKARRLEDLAKPFQQRAKNFRVYAEAREKARHHDRAKSDRDIADLAESDAALLREAAQLMRERGTLLTGPDWKGMYEAQERDMAALRKRVGELEADLATAGSNVHTLRDELREAQQQMAADAMLIAEAQRGAEIVADTERRLERRIAELEAERDAAKAGEARAVEARGEK